MKYISPNCQMYLSKVLTVFVYIAIALLSAGVLCDQHIHVRARANQDTLYQHHRIFQDLALPFVSLVLHPTIQLEQNASRGSGVYLVKA